MNAEGQMAQQGSKRFRLNGKLPLIFLVAFTYGKYLQFFTLIYFSLARVKKTVNNSTNQTTPQSEYRNTVRRTSGVTQSQRTYFVPEYVKTKKTSVSL